MVNARFRHDVLPTEVSSFLLRHEIHNNADQGISSGIIGDLAIDTETLAAEVLGECSPEVGECVFGPLGRSIATGRGFGQMRTVDPGHGRRRHAEIQMIGHRIGVAGLRLGTADFLLDLAESGFNFRNCSGTPCKTVA